jgi:3-oxoacyl-[acyl-carrier protein] reductase
MDLRGASALVTGAGRGIGRAVAAALGREGVAVTLVVRTASEIDAVARQIVEAGGRAHAIALDVTASGAPDRAVAAAVQAHGGLQILVNNAGIGGHASIAATSDVLFDRILATNLTAPFRLTRAALPHLSERGGHVFMVSSLAGQNAIAEMGAYCASKAGLDHLTACLMLEVRHQGIKVTTVAPGSVDTGFGRDDGERRDAPWMLQPEDVATAIVDLLRTRDDAHLSRVEMRPLRPPRR